MITIIIPHLTLCFAQVAVPQKQKSHIFLDAFEQKNIILDSCLAGHDGCWPKHVGSMGLVYVPTWMVDFMVNVGKYTSPMGKCKISSTTCFFFRDLIPTMWRIGNLPWLPALLCLASTYLRLFFLQLLWQILRCWSWHKGYLPKKECMCLQNVYVCIFLLKETLNVKNKASFHGHTLYIKSCEIRVVTQWPNHVQPSNRTFEDHFMPKTPTSNKFNFIHLLSADFHQRKKTIQGPSPDTVRSI